MANEFTPQERTFDFNGVKVALLEVAPNVNVVTEILDQRNNGTKSILFTQGNSEHVTVSVTNQYGENYTNSEGPAPSYGHSYVYCPTTQSIPLSRELNQKTQTSIYAKFLESLDPAALQTLRDYNANFLTATGPVGIDALPIGKNKSLTGGFCPN